MTRYEAIKQMDEAQLSRFLCAVSADVWGYCKAEPDGRDMECNRIWLNEECNGIPEVGNYGR